MECQCEKEGRANSMVRSYFRALLIGAMPRSRLLHRICRKYVDQYNGDNNCDIRCNGELRWIKEVIPKCATVFDVGANIGEWSDLVLHINPSVKVHCFEPCSTTFERLQKRNFGKSVVLNQLALSDHTGEAIIHIFGECAGTNSLYRRQGLKDEQKKTEIIRGDTLDAYCKRKDIDQIDLLKMDVEGHELMVLKGSARMLAEGRIKRIQFEYGGAHIDANVFLKDIFGVLNSYGFQLYKIYPREIRRVDRYNQEFENFQTSNWVALC
jgi:FkbM family methyltransferase